MGTTPYEIGTAAQANGVSDNITVYLGAGTVVPAGDSIYIFVAGGSGALASVTVTDSQNNSYFQLESDTSEANASMVVFSSTLIGAQLTGAAGDAGDYITIDTNADTVAMAVIAIGDTDVGNTSYVVTDKSVIAHGSSTSPSSGSSGTLSSAYEHAIGAIAWESADTLAWGATFSGNVLGSAHGGSGGTEVQVSAAYHDVTATTALTASGTLSGSTEWTAVVLTDYQSQPYLVTVVPSLTEGIAVTIPLSAAGGSGTGYTYSITSGALPSGMSLSAGNITGTPTVNGSFSFTIQVEDSTGITATSAQTITVWPTGPSGASSVNYENNLLTVADSFFEVGMLPSWSAVENASVPIVSTSVALFGEASLIWTATASGNTIIETAAYNVMPLTPYVVSGFVLPAGSRQCYIGINFYNAASTLIATYGGSGDVTGIGENTSAFQSWQPCQQPCTAPAGSVTAKIFIEIDGVVQGETTALDGVFLTKSYTQILVDWENPSFGTQAVTGNIAGDDFMDITAWVRQDQTLNINRGRQDNISEIQSGAASFTLQNDSGIFTKFNGDSVINFLGEYGGQVDLQRRVQINRADQDGNWYIRFDGVIAEIDYTFDPTGNTSLAVVTCADVMAPLSRQDELNCWTKSQVLANGPRYHWSLDDTGTLSTLGGVSTSNQGAAGVAAETSGNNGPPMRIMCSDSSNPTVATIAWQNSTGGVETQADAVQAGFYDGSEYWFPGTNMPASLLRGLDSGTTGPYGSPISNVYFTPKNTAQAAQNTYVGNLGYMLTVNMPETDIIAPVNQNTNYSFECWFFTDPGLITIQNENYGPFVFWSLGSARVNGNAIVAGFFLRSGGANPYLEIAYYDQPPAYAARSGYTGPSPVSNGAGNGTTPVIQRDWTLDTIQIPHHFVAIMNGDVSAPTMEFYVDGDLIGTWDIDNGQTFDTLSIGGAHKGCGSFWGGVSLVSIYDFALNAGQITADCMLGQYGMWEQTTDNVIALLADYANVPSYWLSSDLQTLGFNGLTMTDYQDITDSNAFSNMETWEQTEAGLLFTTAAGQLTFHTRDWRMGYGAPDLYLPPDSFDASFDYSLIDQYQNNEAGFSTNLYSGGTGYANVASQEQYGDYVTNYGSILSSVELPFITWSRAYAQLGIEQYQLWQDPILTDMAQWFANSRAVPYLTPSNLTIDLLTLNPNTGLTVSDFFNLEIDNMIAPNGELPNSFPTGTLSVEWFIEGINETWSLTQNDMIIYTSPAETQRAWRPADATYGVLDQTTRVGVSAADTNAPAFQSKDVSHDAGPPYWPPNFFALYYNFLTNSNLTTAYYNANSGTDWTVASVTANYETSPPAGCPTENCYELIYTTSGGYIHQFPAVGPGNEYTVACVAYAASSGQELYFKVNEYDNNGNYLDTQTSPNMAVTSGGWNFYSWTFTTGESTNNAYIGVGPTSGSTVYVTYIQCGQGTGTGLNNPAANGHEFVGSLEMRGIAYNLQQMLTPPMCVVGLTGNTQTQASGVLTNPTVQWDTVMYDNLGGMGLAPDYSHWYVVQVPGYYEIEASIGYQASGTTGGSMSQAWIVVAIEGMQTLQDPDDSGTPLTNGQYGCPIGETARWTGITTDEPNVFQNPATRMYLGIGDMVAIATEQDCGVSRNTGDCTNGGSHMSLRWLGFGTEGDWAQVNSSINGGSIVNPGLTTVTTKFWENTGSYSYRYLNPDDIKEVFGAGIQGGSVYGASNVHAYQGDQGSSNPSSYAFLPMPASVNTTLEGAVIRAVNITCTNYSTYDSSGAYLILGYYTNTEWSNYDPGHSYTPLPMTGNKTYFPWAASGSPGWWFKPGETRTINVSADFIENYLSNSGAGLFIGTDDYDLYTKHDYSGIWRSKPGQFILTVAYSA